MVISFSFSKVSIAHLVALYGIKPIHFYVRLDRGVILANTHHMTCVTIVANGLMDACQASARYTQLQKKSCVDGTAGGQVEFQISKIALYVKFLFLVRKIM